MGATANEVPGVRETRDHPLGRAVPPAGPPHPGTARRTAGDVRSLVRSAPPSRRGGPEALEDRPSRPRQVWNRIPEAVRSRLIDLALAEPGLSPRELGRC